VFASAYCISKTSVDISVWNTSLTISATFSLGPGSTVRKKKEKDRKEERKLC
jgi:hypothetical protein